MRSRSRCSSWSWTLHLDGIPYACHMITPSDVRMRSRTGSDVNHLLFTKWPDDPRDVWIEKIKAAAADGLSRRFTSRGFGLTASLVPAQHFILLQLTRYLGLSTSHVVVVDKRCLVVRKSQHICCTVRLRMSTVGKIELLQEKASLGTVFSLNF